MATVGLWGLMGGPGRWMLRRNAGLEREADDVKGYLKDLEARMAGLRKSSA